MSATGNGRTSSRGPVLRLTEGRAAASGLRALRTVAGLAPAELASRLGADPKWLQRRELGSVRMTRDEAEKAAAELGTDFAGLLAAGSRAIAERETA
jgi:transcriptional regulator with XRE-family HTH domain